MIYANFSSTHKINLEMSEKILYYTIKIPCTTNPSTDITVLAIALTDDGFLPAFVAVIYCII